MDLTRFMHTEPARLLVCERCGLLVRDDVKPSGYADDSYDFTLLNHVYPRYLQAFEEKRIRYEPLLRPGADVIEVGSHLGAFLEAAENWGWRPIGLDVGAETSAFARKKGATVRRETLPDCSASSCRPDAIFIWNCFEQLEDPVETLATAHRLLNKHGLIVLRVPNVEFYLEQSRMLTSSAPPGALRQLGYNNLLAFPYRLGYSASRLARLIRSSGFEPVRTYGTTLLTPPYPDLSRRIQKEWRATKLAARTDSPGSWIEIAARRLTG